MEKNQ